MLRLVIGWHFYMEGVAHHADPSWTSEGFLRQAKGPLAESYQAMLPNFHDWNVLILAPSAEPSTTKPDGRKADAAAAVDKSDPDDSAKPNKSAPSYKAWLEKTKADWNAEVKAVTDFYRLDKDQQNRAGEILKSSVAQMDNALAGYDADIRLYRRLADRAQRMEEAPGADDIPNMKARAAAVKHDPLSEKGVSGSSAVLGAPPAAWQAEAKGIEQLFHDRLAALPTAEQKKLGAAPSESSKLHRIDAAVAWMLMIVGGCLIVGLFSRLAAVVGALFLLSIICTQPPWIADTIPIYNQVVECAALFALATLPAGRWGGLDYFIHRLAGACCTAKGKKI